MSRRRTLWTIEELTARVQQALGAADYDGVESGRVTDVPALRTIRYYTTLGLLDRPAQMQGRTAFYSTRHLLQLVAIKRLQAQGLPLSAVQEQLAGVPDAALRKVAQVPAHVMDAPLEDVNAEQAAAPSRRESAFWRTPAAAPQPTPPEAQSQTFQTVLVHQQLMVMVQAAAPLSPQDMEAVQQAAQALLNTLTQRGIIKP